MRVLSGLSSKVVHSTGLHRLCADACGCTSYVLVRVGDSLELYPESSEVISVEPGVRPTVAGWIETSAGWRRLLMEDARSFTVASEDGAGAVTILKPGAVRGDLASYADYPVVGSAPKVELSEEKAANKPADKTGSRYDFAAVMSASSISEPPFSGMNKAIWLKAIDKTPRVRGNLVVVGIVLNTYNKLKQELKNR